MSEPLMPFSAVRQGEPFHTIPSIARALGVPPTKVRRAVKAGFFPTYRFGDKRILLRLSEVLSRIEIASFGSMSERKTSRPSSKPCER